MMRNFLVLLLLFCFLTPILSADEDTKAAEANTKASGRVEAAGTVLDEIQAAPDQRIPEEVLGSAECVAVVPSLLNAGFVFGGRYGKGVASCRTPKGWSAPAFFT
ncbi:MAG TPA: lipid-binding SYLF domain-containing protein, partial [Terriglobales bacterium]|nr:lipid-binding SYLF domain-containing protein [Terriglobales bacterium]